METWIIFAITAYFLLAVNGIADKFLLTKSVKHPVAYAFYVGITGPLTFTLGILGYFGGVLGISFLKQEFSLEFLNTTGTLVAFLGGACFPVALYFLYVAIQKTSISRVLPTEGALVPLFTFVFSFFILHEELTVNQAYAFLFLVLGTILISGQTRKEKYHTMAFGSAVLAAAFFALSFVLTKYVFNHVNFGSGLMWTRLGFFLASLSFLVPHKNREYIFNAPKETTTGNKFVYLAARVSGGVSGFLQNYAISLGSVSLVNALQSTQYAFLLLMTVFLSVKFPKILKEDISRRVLVLKILAIVIISFGLWLLTKNS